jgi:lipoprotein-anchoring transpeptidase ErfK/SrfK
MTFLILTCLLAVSAPALGGVVSDPQEPARDGRGTQDAARDGRGTREVDDELLARPARVQTMLARAGFSPGLIDGKPGPKTRAAVEWFQRSVGLPATPGGGGGGRVDAATFAALETASGLASDAPWTRTYTITERDVASITGPIPEDWNERALLQFSGYTDMEDLLAERGWCSVEAVRRLNPGVDLLALGPGAEVVLPDVGSPPRIPRLESLEIDLAAKLVKGLDADGRVVFLTHCSIARSAEKRPAGELSVTVVATDPEYTFNPKFWPEVTNVERPLRIAPGPRNPVGSAWIGLSLPGYGVHGTVRPADIGKTGSHGCFRLTNWDALRLARSVRSGMRVVVAE